ncbi:DUF2851 family protein [Flavobacterium enshiense]|uniref:DUF2851 family protein n=1 Tax=Flavobacterium enshiense TaxID=1341165 RepID=UPI00345D42A8
MKEDFLRHIWQYRKFDFSELQTVQGEKLQILHTGYCLQITDSVFFNAQLIIGNLRWAGSISVCMKSSDWNLIHCSDVLESDNLILLAVYDHDTAVYRKDKTEIPVLELKHYVTQELVESSLDVRVEKIIKFVTVLWD